MLYKTRLFSLSKLASIVSFASILMACGGGTTTDNNVANVPDDSTGTGGNTGTGDTGNGNGTGSARLTWLSPTENTNGTPLTNLAEFNIYDGTTKGVYSKVDTVGAGITEYVMDDLSNSTTYYFVVTAVNKDGVESQYSTVKSKTTAKN